MATVNGLTAEAMQEIVDQTIVDAEVDGSYHLILTKHDGSTVDAGNVRGPAGPTGPSSALNNFWPVGSIYMSVNPTNPNTVLGGGTWAAWGTGRVAVAVDTAQTEFNTVEKTGGEKTHQLTVNEMPSHDHGPAGDHDHQLSMTPGTGNNSYPVRGQGSGSVSVTSGASISNAGEHTHPSEGEDQPHNNLQPYITCYFWKRTA